MRLIDADYISYYKACANCSGDSCDYCEEDYIANKCDIDSLPTIEVENLKIDKDSVIMITVDCSSMESYGEQSDYMAGVRKAVQEMFPDNKVFVKEAIVSIKESKETFFNELKDSLIDAIKMSEDRKGKVGDEKNTD